MVFRKILPSALVSIGVCCLFASCSTTEPPSQISLVRAEYPHLPCGAFSAKLRAKGEQKPALKKKFFWGNYGGPGSLGGEPCDELDWIFYRHDTAYLDGVTLRELREADRVLIRELKAVDPEGLSPDARAYRKRAIRYFRNPISRWVGKPKDVLLRKKRGPTEDWQ